MPEGHEGPDVQDYFTQFKELPVLGIMQIPANKLQTITSDFGLSSHSKGPIQGYALQKVHDDGRVERAIFIADGNHRYHQAIRDARLKASLEHREFHIEEVMIELQKVIPDPENDIRIIWDATDWTDLK